MEVVVVTQWLLILQCLQGVRVDAVWPWDGIPARLGWWWVLTISFKCIKTFNINNNVTTLTAFGIIHELGKSPWGWSSAQHLLKRKYFWHIFSSTKIRLRVYFTKVCFKEPLVREFNETRQLPLGQPKNRQRASLDYCSVVLIQMGPTRIFKCYQEISKSFLYNLQHR